MIFNCSHFNPVNIGSTTTEQMAFASTTCETPNTFTEGELIISFFLFLVLIFLMTQFIREWIFKKKYKNE